MAHATITDVTDIVFDGDDVLVTYRVVYHGRDLKDERGWDASEITVRVAGDDTQERARGKLGTAVADNAAKHGHAIASAAVRLPDLGKVG